MGIHGAPEVSRRYRGEVGNTRPPPRRYKLQSDGDGIGLVAALAHFNYCENHRFLQSSTLVQISGARGKLPRKAWIDFSVPSLFFYTRKKKLQSKARSDFGTVSSIVIISHWTNSKYSQKHKPILEHSCRNTWQSLHDESSTDRRRLLNGSLAASTNLFENGGAC